MEKKLPARRWIYDRGLRALLWLCGGLVCALLVFIIGYIFARGLPRITWELLSTQSSVLRGTVGILPHIASTVYIILVSMVIVLPLGVGAAIYLTEYATNRRLAGLIEFAAETLTGIPSIIYGLVGMMVFLQLMGLKAGILAGGLTLVVMILPTIIRTTQESLKTVPQSYREGALGLGAGKWHMIRTVVLPNAVDGIVTGCILAVGRIVGESAALLFTAGPLSVCQRAGRDGDRLCHRRHPDDPDPDHQPGRRSCGTAAEEVRGAGLIRPTLIRQRSNLNGKYHPVCPTAEFILW